MQFVSRGLMGGKGPSGGGFSNGGSSAAIIVEEGGFITLTNSNSNSNSRAGGGALTKDADFGVLSYVADHRGGKEDSGDLLELVANQGQQQQQQHGHGQLNASFLSLYAPGASGMSLQRRPRRGGVASNPCRDCGNQAKKDCMHLRCRSCCKCRGFRCQTHMQSTWVSATQRRERERDRVSSLARRSKCARILALSATKSLQNTCNSSASTANAIESEPHLPPNLLLSYGQDIRSVGRRFPSEVRATTMFKCVKMSALTKDCNVKSEYAYKTTIKIGDHTFKGVLYDQGYSSLTSSDHHHHHEEGSDKGDEGWPLLNSNNSIGMSQEGLVGEKMQQEVSRLVSGSWIDHVSSNQDNFIILDGM